jgi:membrane associated rhomboid family serine protease
LALFVGIAKISGRDTSKPMMDVRAFNGEPWRVLTTALPHADILHLAFNLGWLWAFGAALEQRYGSARLILWFALLEGGATLAEYALSGSGIGLSGIVYGLFGMLLILHRRDPELSDTMNVRTAQLFIAWFFFCIAATVLDLLPVGNVAHGMGALLGVLLGLVVGSRERRRIKPTLLLSATLVMCLVGATVGRPLINLSSGAGTDAAFLGYHALDGHRDEEAIWFCREAVRMRPRRADWWFNLGVAYQRTTRFDDAQKAYEIATHLEPSSLKYRVQFLRMLGKHKNDPDWIEQYNEAMEHDE